jgi:hypothetical protein
MRTTIDIEPDVLNAAKEIVRQKHIRVGKVISELLRQALTGNTGDSAHQTPNASSTGFDPFPARGVLITNELIRGLRDAEGI